MAAGGHGRGPDRRAAIASGTVDGDELGRKLDLLHRIFREHPFPSAVEDLPPDGRDQLAEAAAAAGVAAGTAGVAAGTAGVAAGTAGVAAEVAGAAGVAGGPEPQSLLARVLDEVADAGLDSYGDLETVPLLRFLSRYPVTSYTYVASPVLSRGERPSPAKLRDLAAQGYQRTVNLCAEIPGGDLPLLLLAGRPGSVQTVHIPIVDMHNPTPGQVVQLLDLLTAPDAPRTYLHCEAGKCRTGVMAAGYRMAVLGWSVDDAYAEAENFGCSVPHQKEFIRDFGAALQRQDQARAQGKPEPEPELGRYPLRPPGSAQPTPEQRRATLDEVARQEKGQTE
jgi:Tyrosine phosphatase family